MFKEQYYYAQLFQITLKHLWNMMANAQIVCPLEYQRTQWNILWMVQLQMKNLTTFCHKMTKHIRVYVSFLSTSKEGTYLHFQVVFHKKEI